MKKYAVLAVPPKTGIYSDLKPRFQMWAYGSTVEYDSKEEAEAWARACNSDRNSWTYSVRELAPMNESKDSQPMDRVMQKFDKLLRGERKLTE